MRACVQHGPSHAGTPQATGIEKLIFELQRIRAQTNTMVDTYYYQVGAGAPKEPVRSSRSTTARRLAGLLATNEPT